MIANYGNYYDSPAASYQITLDAYEIANLRAALEAVLTFPRNPLHALNNGDWICQIYNKLPKVEHKPNQQPVETVLMAIEIAIQEIRAMSFTPPITFATLDQKST